MRVPVYLRVEDVPLGRMRPGERVAVWEGGDRFRFFEYRATADEAGLGFALPAAAAAGSAAGPVGALVGVGVAAIPALGRLFGKLFGGGGPSKDERAAADYFERLAGETKALFDSIQLQKAVVTPADVAAAEQKLTELAQAAAQLQGVEYVARQWSSSPYKPTLEQRLGQIRQAAAQAAAPGPGGSSPGGGSSPSFEFPKWAIYAAGGVVLWKVIFR